MSSCQASSISSQLDDCEKWVNLSKKAAYFSSLGHHSLFPTLSHSTVRRLSRERWGMFRSDHGREERRCELKRFSTITAVSEWKMIFSRRDVSPALIWRKTRLKFRCVLFSDFELGRTAQERESSTWVCFQLSRGKVQSRDSKQLSLRIPKRKMFDFFISLLSTQFVCIQSLDRDTKTLCTRYHVSSNS